MKTSLLRKYNTTVENLTPPSPDAPIEKDFSPTRSGVYHNEYRNGYHQHLDSSHDSELALRKIQTAGSISITPELFEKLYLSPQNRVKGDLRKTFGNPTPIALVGFLISLFPLSMALMGWRGAGNNGASSIGSYFFFGGVLMIVGSIGEWIIGNTFPFVAFGSFGAFWLAFAATLTPEYNAFGAYSTTSNPVDGLNTVGFRSGFAFFLLSMALLSFIFFVCSLRTNVCFAAIFFFLVLTFCMLTAAYLQLNNRNEDMAASLLKAGGAFGFVTCIFGWWIFVAIMLASLDFPFALPVGDLSRFIKAASERDAEKNQ
ncbi:GPR1/FUN34/YaaH-class plasma membrane protein-like protein [Byssothecium circinans]|uniref:GPR1/FUN34/YaaH-class plasma membrane protein-like protein n=1 Tax=Byssothecium circinans TaxID=147558 RepID=A0A6A5T6B8_9PLEO|nr:GPR1/FUN34/YaaH-class plasma membrane protein-like protein [Byssothecium circinans]